MVFTVHPQTDALPASIRQIVAEIERMDHPLPAEIRRIVLEADVKPGELEPWTDFDHPAKDSYGRKLVHKGENYEIMVMSWRPGDFSAIHDHGFTQWGAVQIFGPAEHAIFRLDDGQIQTLARWRVKKGTVVGVNQTLIHQMGNPELDTFFLSLHVYGDWVKRENVTARARLFELDAGEVRRVNGGVFFAMPEKETIAFEGRVSGDFPTRLRHRVELYKRLQKIQSSGSWEVGDQFDALYTRIFDPACRKELIDHVDTLVDENGFASNSVQWRILKNELIEASRVQQTGRNQGAKADHFHRYAEMYDELVGKPCLAEFMVDYLFFVVNRYNLDLSGSSLISLGCGTGLAENYIMNAFDIPHEQLYGIDISGSMIAEARRRIQADTGNILTLDPGIRMWDFTFSGLNVFQYIPSNRLEEAIEKTAAIVRTGGLFIGDFIAPDHIRQYVNLKYNEDRTLISLRSPELIEEEGRMYMASEIVNISFRGPEMDLNYAGRHRRFLPPIHRVRNYFKKAFGPEVDLYDAVSLDPIPDWADSCKSTRYVVVAKKAG